MSPKIKNIIIFVVIFLALLLGYFLFMNKGSEESNLVSSSQPSQSTQTTADASVIRNDFLSILLNVKTIRLDASIFSDKAFMSLQDSSITLVPTGDEGRPNPFAPISQNEIKGVKSATPPVSSDPVFSPQAEFDPMSSSEVF